MSARVQVFGRRDDEAIHALMRPATEKRQGTKSREVGQRRCSGCYGDYTVALQGVGARSRSRSSVAICSCISASLAISRVISLASRGGNGHPSPVTSLSICRVLYLLLTLMPRIP